MPLHIIKLAVGIESVEDLETRVRRRFALGGDPDAVEMLVQTRMMPTRKEEIVGTGSLYWVIKSQVVARQPLIDIRAFTDTVGIKRCWLVLKPEVVRTVPRPRKPFQGWRYGKPEDVPADLLEADREMPEEMRKELARLGLL